MDVTFLVLIGCAATAVTWALVALGVFARALFLSWFQRDGENAGPPLKAGPDGQRRGSPAAWRGVH